VKAADDCCGGGRDVTSPRASSFGISLHTFAACCHIILGRIAGNYCFFGFSGFCLLEEKQ